MYKFILNKYLLFSVEIGNVECIKRCIENGADVHVNDNEALRRASFNGHYNVVKLLLEYGADVHACDDAALVFASNLRHHDVVELLENYARKYYE